MKVLCMIASAALVVAMILYKRKIKYDMYFNIERPCKQCGRSFWLFHICCHHISALEYDQYLRLRDHFDAVYCFSDKHIVVAVNKW